MAAPPPQRLCNVLPDELVTEILARLPLRNPACLRRFSLVCKAWYLAVTERPFRRRLGVVHAAPPLLGFLHNSEEEGLPRFIPTTASPFTLAAPDCLTWRVLDCRHGRALFLSKAKDELLLWEPITGFQLRVPVPVAFATDYGVEKASPTAAVFCPADPCGHQACQGGPFRLVFVFSIKVDTDLFVTRGCLYSSETRLWREPTLMEGPSLMEFTRYSSVLVGSSNLYFMADSVSILGYNLASHNMNVINPPPSYYNPGYVGRFSVMLVKDHGLGVCQYVERNLKLWTREASGSTVTKWALSRDINLCHLLPVRTLLRSDSRARVLGFAEGANEIFFNTRNGIYTVEVELQPLKPTYVCKEPGISDLIPVVSFYTPVPRGGELAVLPLPCPSEEQAICEEGGEEEKMHECVGHEFETRDLSYGEAECVENHGHALSSEVQEVIDPLGDVPTFVTNKGDAGNSNTSGSNVKDAAPNSKKERVCAKAEEAS
ncbi:unnamed protein product [Alopecurus aequalis]